MDYELKVILGITLILLGSFALLFPLIGLFLVFVFWESQYINGELFRIAILAALAITSGFRLLKNLNYETFSQ